MDYDELDRLIADLEAAVEDTNPQKGYWRELWALVREIGDGFRGTRYPTAADRQATWGRFQALVAKAKARSAESQARLERSHREWDERQDQSRLAKEQVQSRAARARPLSSLERGIADLVLLPASLIATIVMKLIGLEAPSQVEEIRQELVACGEQLREAWRVFQERKHELLPGDRSQAYESLQSARQQLDDAWKRWKDAKAALGQRKQREWEERQRAREAHHAEQQRRHREFVVHVEANIAKLAEKLSKAKATLHRQEAHREELRDKYTNAWSESFKDRCSDWIDECENRIANIKEQIERLEGWIGEEREKLR